MTRDHQDAAERLNAVDETEESRSLGGVGTADSVVSNREMQIGTLGVDAHLDVSRSRVFGRVRKGFGDNVVRGHLGESGNRLSTQGPVRRGPRSGGPAP